MNLNKFRTNLSENQECLTTCSQIVSYCIKKYLSMYVFFCFDLKSSKLTRTHNFYQINATSVLAISDEGLSERLFDADPVKSYNCASQWLTS